MSRFVKPLALLALSLAGVMPLAAQMSARAGIDAANARMMSTFNRGDGFGLGNLYSPDAVLMPPHAPASYGRAAIANYWDGGVKAGVRNLRLNTTEVHPLGDMAHEMGTYSMDIKPPNGAMMHDHGKYAVLWKRDPKAGWQLHRDIWNSDVAAPH